jgi:DNA-binding NarL/FixJ family response regulator
MPIHQVYVIWTHQLVRDSLRQLLDHTDITWVGAASDFSLAIEEISRLHPDTILIEEVVDETTTTAFMEIIEKFQWNLRVVGVSLDDNQLSIYQHEQQMVGQPEDLIRLIIQ